MPLLIAFSPLKQLFSTVKIGTNKDKPTNSKLTNFKITRKNPAVLFPEKQL